MRGRLISKKLRKGYKITWSEKTTGKRNKASTILSPTLQK
jgi:hypothetical protein